MLIMDVKFAICLFELTHSAYAIQGATNVSKLCCRAFVYVCMVLLCGKIAGYKQKLFKFM